MKKIIRPLLLGLLLIAITVTATACGNSDSVLICRSKSAYAYHSHYCRGLNRCTHTVMKVTIRQAKQMGYNKACGFCYGQSAILPTRATVWQRFKIEATFITVARVHALFATCYKSHSEVS